MQNLLAGAGKEERAAERCPLLLGRGITASSMYCVDELVVGGPCCVDVQAFHEGRDSRFQETVISIGMRERALFGLYAASMRQ